MRSFIYKIYSKKMESNLNKLKTYNKRYIENKYSGLDLSANLVDLELIPQLKKNLESSLIDYISKSEIEEYYIKDSRGEKDYNYTIYSGTGSIMYMFWRYYLLCASKNYGDLQQAIAYLKLSIEKNLNIQSQLEVKSHKSPSFFMSEVGTYTMSCIFNTILENEAEFQKHFDKVLSHKDQALKKAEYELLYGDAGYLYSLLIIKKHCGKFLDQERNQKINKVILEVLKHLHAEGVKHMNHFKANLLVWPWPKKSTKSLAEIYLGAAHGVIGILYIMIQSLISLGVVTSQKSNEDEISEIISNLKNSLDNLALLRFETGNFPSSYGKEKDNLVHFCHGETGAISLYILASDYFKKMEYLEIALKSGEDLWNRGLLLKGNGLCHGISGGAYALFSIYMSTKETTWRTRAYLFANATFDEDVQSLCRNHKDPQRQKTGVPDSPNSLMEGEAGVITLLSDLLNDDDYVKFPGYEI